uniref:Uncharacterized protein n=1 Tax=Oryza meridionalis TaxID=40149 RepID=A0A0E0CDZ3_9ORYZ
MDLGGILDSNASRLSSLVPRMVIFLRMAEVWRMISGPDCGSEPLSAIMEVTSSASLDASLYSLTHGSEDDAIPSFLPTQSTQNHQVTTSQNSSRIQFNPQNPQESSIPKRYLSLTTSEILNHEEMGTDREAESAIEREEREGWIGEPGGSVENGFFVDEMDSRAR